MTIEANRTNVEFETLIGNLRELFGPACALMNVPVGIGHDFSGVVSTVNIPTTTTMYPGKQPKASPMSPFQQVCQSYLAF